MQNKIREIRKKKGLTQEELAKKAGVSRGWICSLENGYYTVTSTKTLKKIADALGKKVSDIFLI